jgi:hypothetical protein
MPPYRHHFLFMFKIMCTRLKQTGCGSNQNFLDRGLLLTRKLLNQGFLLVKGK